jgi:hypothetical protein
MIDGLFLRTLDAKTRVAVGRYGCDSDAVAEEDTPDTDGAIR